MDISSDRHGTARKNQGDLRSGRFSKGDLNWKKCGPVVDNSSLAAAREYGALYAEARMMVKAVNWAAFLESVSCGL